MILIDLSNALIGKSKRKLCLNFLFPNIYDNKNLLNKNFSEIENFSSDSYKRLINLEFDNKLNTNSYATIFIYTLLKYNNIIGIDNILGKYNDTLVDALDDFSQYSERFKQSLDYIYHNELIPKKYIDIIYTYIKYEYFDCALFLIVSTLMLSTTMQNDADGKLNKHKTTIDDTGKTVNLYNNFKEVVTIIDSFENYKDYMKEKDFIFEEYIPIKQETLEVNKQEIQSDNVTIIQKKNISFNFNNKNQYFFESLLDDLTCKEIHILSRFAHSWAYHDTYEKMFNRLEKNSLTIKMLLMDINVPFAELYNDKQNSIKYNYFGIFEDLSKRFPDNFQIKYVTIPLTNRIFQDCSNHKMRVDFLTMPPITKDVFKQYFDKNNPKESIHYNQYSKQFDELWNKYSISAENQYDYCE